MDSADDSIGLPDADSGAPFSRRTPFATSSIGWGPILPFGALNGKPSGSVLRGLNLTEPEVVGLFTSPLRLATLSEA